jgi:hypothetical protein
MHFSSLPCVLNASLILSSLSYTPVIFGEAYKLCSLLQTPATSSILGPNILLTTFLSNTLNLCSSQDRRDKQRFPFLYSDLLIKPGQFSRCSDWLRAGRSDDRGSISGGGWEFFSSTPCPGKKPPRYPLDRRLGGSQSRSERGGEGKKIPAAVGNRTPVV